ncbi:hypothetical protein CYMTET_35003 [Cymbomonas tetramitiformis]|uniref:PRA1 family protein n=1 Tax=Cymbomonas tetramitiformis TaxID=36881 RepID=A0AAE0FA10_9CHLO|nr:hypothetical protein CYMTET_35003 [Cymbomonas tetramitiformis]
MSENKEQTDASAPGTFGWLYLVQNWSSSMLSRRQPWREMVHYRMVSSPDGFTDIMYRLRKNIPFFFYNYVIILLTIAVGIIVCRPKSLEVLAALLMLWIYVFAIRNAELVVKGRTISIFTQRCIMAGFSFLTIFYFTDMGLILSSGLSAGIAVIVLHAAFRTPEPDPESESATTWTGLQTFVQTSVTDKLSSFSTQSLPFKIPDNPFTRRLERAVDSLAV